MSKVLIQEDIFWVGSQDPDREIFDALMPLPYGTTYNAYLVKGSEKTVLIDSVDPDKMADLFRNLEGVNELDYVVCLHTEQDHSGSIPEVLGKYPKAKVLCLAKTKVMMQDLMKVDDERFEVVEDGGSVSIGNKTLQFMHFPWVHWPDNSAVYIPEDKILFSSDLFGSHYAFGEELFAGDKPIVFKEAKEYYAEIMMLYARVTGKYIDRIRALDIEKICASHGPVYDQPKLIIDLYDEWMRGAPKNMAVVAFVSTHGSTRIMAEHLAAQLTEQGVEARLFDLVGLPLNDISSSLVDAATIVLGSSVVMAALHPFAVNTAFLLDRIKPKARFAAVFGSYGWSPGPLKKAAELLPSLKVEVVGAVIAKGHPKDDTLDELSDLAATIAAKHRDAGIL